MEHPLKKPIKTGTVGSILASLFRQIIFECNIGTDRINSLLSRYAEKTGIAANAKEVSNIRGSLNKEISAESFSWRVFIKGLSGLLNVGKFEIGVKLYHRNGLISVHRQTVILDDLADDNVSDDALEQTIYNGPSELNFIEKGEKHYENVKPNIGKRTKAAKIKNG